MVKRSVGMECRIPCEVGGRIKLHASPSTPGRLLRALHSAQDDTQVQGADLGACQMRMGMTMYRYL
jgi:hypothetical protein